MRTYAASRSLIGGGAVGWSVRGIPGAATVGHGRRAEGAQVAHGSGVFVREMRSVVARRSSTCWIGEGHAHVRGISLSDGDQFGRKKMVLPLCSRVKPALAPVVTSEEPSIR